LRVNSIISGVSKVTLIEHINVLKSR